MAKYVLLDEIHVEIRAPTDMPEKEILAVRKVLFSRRFRREFVERVHELIAALDVSDGLRIAINR